MKNWIELITAGASLVAAGFAAKSSNNSAKAAKIGSNPTLKLLVLDESISPSSFSIRISNLGAGLAKDIVLKIPAINLEQPFSIVENGSVSSRQSIQDPNKQIHIKKKYCISYKNIFGDKLVTNGEFIFEESQSPRVCSGETKWDVNF